MNSQCHLFLSTFYSDLFFLSLPVHPIFTIYISINTDTVCMCFQGRFSAHRKHIPHIFRSFLQLITKFLLENLELLKRILIFVPWIQLN